MQALSSDEAAQIEETRARRNSPRFALRRYGLIASLLLLIPAAWLANLAPLAGWFFLGEAFRRVRATSPAVPVEALALLDRAAKLSPSCTYVDLLRGLCFLGKPGYDEQARQHFLRFCEGKKDGAALLLRAVLLPPKEGLYPLANIDPRACRVSDHTAIMLAAIALSHGKTDHAGAFLRHARRHRNRSMLYQYHAGILASVQEKFTAALANLERASALRFKPKRIPNLAFGLTPARFHLVAGEGSLGLQKTRWAPRVVPFEVGTQGEALELLYNLVVLFRAQGKLWRSYFMAQILHKNKEEALRRIGMDKLLEPYLYPRNYRVVVEPQAKELGIDPFLVYAVMREESSFNPKAKSKAGAMGLMQLMPGTARRVARRAGERHFNPSWLQQPARNIELGCRYLARLLKEFSDAPDPIPWVLVAYNAGPQRSRRWLNRWKRRGGRGDIQRAIYIRETRGYVKKCTASYKAYKRLYGKAGG